MSRDRAELMAWYRSAMRGRIEELKALRAPLGAEEPSAFDEARRVGQALRGSGATFGFPDVTATATLLETSSDRDVLRRVEGLIAYLHGVIAGVDDGSLVRPEWLLRSADLPLEGDTLDGVADVANAWACVSRASGLDLSRLADAVARYLELQRAELGSADRAARRLVPEAVVQACRVLPLTQSATTIGVATSDPVSLLVEVELERLTGRTPIFAVAHPEELSEALATQAESTGSAPADPVGSSAPPGDLSERAVLVVDDDPVVRRMLTAVLEKRGFAVCEAEDGVEALERLAQRPDVGLVVADLNMPRMDGLELIWKIRGADGRSGLPVIVVTGETDGVLEGQLIEEGADDYIHKPVDPRLFLARVEATLRRHVART